MTGTLFTIPTLARVLNRAPWGIRKALTGAAPTERVRVRGKPVPAWSLADLPEKLRIQLQGLAQRVGHRSVDELLKETPKSWTMPIPWEQVPKVWQDLAEQSRSAVAALMPLQHTLSAAELQERGQLEYRRAFGYGVEPRKWRTLFDQVVQRDCSQENWQRIDLYVDPRAFTASAVKRDVVKTHKVHAPLDEVVANLENRSNPTADDVAWLKDSAFRHYEAFTLGQPEAERRSFLASLIHYIHSSVPGLSKSQAGLRRTFQTNYKTWVDGGRTPRAIEDKRALRSGKFGERLCKVCRPLVIGGAVDLDGDLAQAWGRLHLQGKICQPCAERWPFNEQRKSYVPASVRDDATPEIKTAMALRRGPRFARKMGPKVRRDWSQIAPCEIFSADDVSFNHPFWYLDASGKVRICRGECLLLTDERTGYIIHYLLIAGVLDSQRTSYTGWHIRQLFLAGHDRFGLPRWGYSLENGIWRSRFIAGEKRCKWTESRWSDVESGLREEGLDLGLHFHLPGQPWTKPIEGVIGIVQQRMGCEPFYVGRNERTDKREKTAEMIQKVRSGSDPAKLGMRSMEQFRQALDQITEQYNATVQNGEMLRDSCGRYMSPAEAIKNGICGRPGLKDEPIKKLSAHSRALLATHKRRCYVNDDGLVIKINNTPWPYWGEALGAYKHKHVWAYLNFELPEVLVCSDEDRQNYFTLKAKVLPARGATKEQMEDISRERGAFMKSAKTLHSRLPHPFVTTVADDNDADERTQEFASAVSEAADSYESESDRLDKIRAEIARYARLVGHAVPAMSRDPQSVLEGLIMEADALGLADRKIEA